MNMYDMTVFSKETWEIIFVTGEKLTIIPPTMRQKYQLAECSGNENQLDALMDVALIVLNNNKEGKTYTKEELLDLMTEKALANFINEYNKWIESEIDSKN